MNIAIRRRGRSGGGNTPSSRRTFSRPTNNSRRGPNNNGHSKFKSGSRPKRHHDGKRQGSPSQAQRRGRGGRKMPTFDPSAFINTNPIQIKEEVYKPKNSFSTFGLDNKFVEDIIRIGLKVPSPIQDQIIPKILEGRDVVGLAETGTGKTAAFLIPLIQKTLNEYTRQTLILTPTRELALQIEDELKKLSRNFRIFSVTCVGGVSAHPQIRTLRRRQHFVVGTPGRILDLINRKHFLTNEITTVVLDEADRMLDMGFIGDMKAILGTTPKNRETLFFSATMPEDIKKLINDFLRDPVMVSVKKKDVIDSIAQDIVHFKHDTKFETLHNMLKEPEFKRVLIFGAMKHSVEKLSKKLIARGIRAESLHGNKNPRQRNGALGKFKSGRADVLVATDVAARGIHIDDVTHVINYDLPNTFEDYVHRIGRTGRATKRGQALTFVEKRQ